MGRAQPALGLGSTGRAQPALHPRASRTPVPLLSLPPKVLGVGSRLGPGPHLSGLELLSPKALLVPPHSPGSAQLATLGAWAARTRMKVGGTGRCGGHRREVWNSPDAPGPGWPEALWARTRIGPWGSLASDLGRAGQAATGPPLEGQVQILGFHHSVLTRLITGLSPSLAIKGWMNRPGTREAPSSGLVSPSLPLRGWHWQQPPGLTSHAHTQFYTLQLTPSHITSQPCDPTQSIKLPAQGGGRGERPKGASERGQGLCLHS